MHGLIKNKIVILVLFLLPFIGLCIKTILSDISPSIVSSEVENQILISKSKSMLSGTFVSELPNLGLIELQSKTNRMASISNFIFRFKQVHQKEWYYSQKIASDAFYHIQPYPIGFPIINKSLGQVFYFELIDPSGNTHFKLPRITTTKHQFTLESIKREPNQLIQYFRYKWLYLNRFFYGQTLILLIFLTIPFFIRIILYRYPEYSATLLKQCRKGFRLSEVLIFVTFLVDVLFVPFTFPFFYILPILILLILVFFRIGVPHSSAQKLFLIFVISCFFFTIIDVQSYAEHSAGWMYIIFVYLFINRIFFSSSS